MIRNHANRSTEKRAPWCMNGRGDGFTLIEALIAMAIVGIVMTAIYGVFITSNKSYHTQDRVAAAQQGVRVGIDFIVRDTRMAGLDPLGDATDVWDGNGAGIKVATSSKIRFTSDIDINGAIDNPNNQERITYEYDSPNNRLRRCLYETTGSESWQTLIDNVSALTFSYLDADGNTTAVTADIRTVVISMTCQGTNAEGQTFTRTLDTRVRCRNL